MQASRRSGVRRCTIALLVLLAACTAVHARSAITAGVPVDFAQDDAMPYDMSAVEQMEHITQRQQVHVAAKVQAAAKASTAATRAEPQLKDAMTDAEQRFFSEQDVDAFLQQRETTLAKAAQTAKEQALAKQKADAKARADAVIAQREAAIQAAKDAEAAKVAAAKALQESQLAEFHDAQPSLLESALASQQEADAQMEQELEAEESSSSESEMDSESEAEAEVEMETPGEHLASVEAQGKQLLERAEFLAKLAAQPTSDQASHAHHSESSFVQTGAASKVKSTQPWWTSNKGVATNAHHYAQGVSNSLIQGSESVSNTANSYSLPLGKTVTAGRLQAKKLGGAPASAQGVAAAAPLLVPVATYGTVPAVGGQGGSVAFNPYSSSVFHPAVPTPAYAPKLPSYMAESQQPWAGAGYYGSGGGQGPHPGSEAFVPLAGVDGKEFGIRAREAWEEHAKQYEADPTAFHDTANQPQYPYFPAWSRKSEEGGRPDIFPKPLYNLPTVNAHANAVAQAAFQHSNTYYPQYNNQITTPAPFVAAAERQATGPVAGLRPQPRLLRQVIGYPRPTPSRNPYSATPAAFPQPLNSNSFDESVNYAQLAKVPTLGVPTSPLAGRNIMINAGPDKGLNPVFGGLPQFVPVPVAAQMQYATAEQPQ